jgi:hypothetical protein
MSIEEIGFELSALPLTENASHDEERVERGIGRLTKPISSVTQDRTSDDDAKVGGTKSFSLGTARESNG